VAGDWEGTAATAAEGLDWTRRHGLDASGAVLVNNRISALVALGRWQEAEREADAALTQTSADGVALTLHLTLAELAALRGEDISAHLLAAAALPGAGADPQLVLYETCARAEQALWRGDPESARLLVTKALQSPHMRDYAYGTLRLAVLLLRADADIAELARAPGARATLDDALARAGSTLATVESARAAGPGTQGLLCVARAEAARVRVAADGATPSLAGFWSTAAQAWAEAGEAYPRAYARFREGSSLLMAGRPATALPALADAFAGAHRLGAEPLARACAGVARAAGVERELVAAASLHAQQETSRSRAPVPPGPRLTLRERQVLEQLAQGSTNRVAARRLGISEKTVAVHLTNVYAKLGVTNRTEAVSVALRSGLVTLGTTG
jgi:DNA-binding CsgD family transcriptional regulator